MPVKKRTTSSTARKRSSRSATTDSREKQYDDEKNLHRGRNIPLDNDYQYKRHRDDRDDDNHVEYDWDDANERRSDNRLHYGKKGAGNHNHPGEQFFDEFDDYETDQDYDDEDYSDMETHYEDHSEYNRRRKPVGHSTMSYGNHDKGSNRTVRHRSSNVDRRQNERLNRGYAEENYNPADERNKSSKRAKPIGNSSMSSETYGNNNSFNNERGRSEFNNDRNLYDKEKNKRSRKAPVKRKKQNSR